jgi:SAM-dependent methyltransferase
MSISQIRASIAGIEKDSSLFDEKNFDRRADAIDFLGFHVIGPAESLLKGGQPTELNLLKRRAEKVKARLEEADNNLFKKLRVNLGRGNCTRETFKDLINEYFDLNSGDNGQHCEPGYDNLDLFINRLFPFDSIPEQTKALEPEMVFYQKTPVRIVFELAEKCQFTKNDVFFDLGSGLGQVAILLNLLTGVLVKGIEFEPAFCNYARDCAAELNLPGVIFINADARKADYSAGTIFFLYTPFTGEMLQQVLELLRKESLKRNIRIVTYGPCTEQAALLTWLHPDRPVDNNIYRLAFFNSF